MRMVLFCYDNNMSNYQFQNNTEKKGYGGASVIVGVISLLAFPIMIIAPVLSLIISAVAIILGAISVDSSRRTLAIIGMILGIISGGYMLLLILG